MSLNLIAEAAPTPAVAEAVAPARTLAWFDGALHDVFLSRREAREDAYRRLERWVVGWRAAHT